MENRVENKILHKAHQPMTEDAKAEFLTSRGCWTPEILTWEVPGLPSTLPQTWKLGKFASGEQASHTGGLYTHQQQCNVKLISVHPGP